MYFLRLMYKDKIGGKLVDRERNFECPDYEVATIRKGHPFTLTPNQITGVPTEVGLHIRTGGSTPQSIQLPKDGHTLFVMNSDGKTIHTYRWPENDTKADAKSEAKEA